MISKKFFGTASDEEIFVYKIKNEAIEAEILNYGAILHSLRIRNKKGSFVDVIGGYNSLEGYMNGLYKHGATIGRCANRIANAKFTIDGREYHLTQNAGKHHIHGGLLGYHKRVWNVETLSHDCIKLYLNDCDGIEGYPGNVQVHLSYRIDDNKFIIDTRAVTDSPTVVNITNHSFFNLNGLGINDIRNHTFEIFCKDIATVDDENIPTGELCDATGTKYDFTKKREVALPEGERYDTTYYFGDKKMKLMAKAFSPDSGISMSLFSDMPSMQFFTVEGSICSHLDKTGKKSSGCSWFCFEPQYVPDTPNNNFISDVLMPDGEYSHRFIYEFG